MGKLPPPVRTKKNARVLGGILVESTERRISHSLPAVNVIATSCCLFERLCESKERNGQRKVR